MKTTHQIYISIGSNIGDRLQYLQQALHAIQMKIGDIVALSSVYQTPSWGFESEDFYNACICVETSLTATAVLPIVLAIEQTLGRARDTSGTYRARTVDLDIILSSEGCIQTSNLQVPHPKLEERNFVLVPLAEIAGGVKHPILQCTVNELLENTTDASILQRIASPLVFPEKDSV